jgi:hypothetical protein
VPCCPHGRSGRWRWPRPPLAHRTTWTRTRRTWSPPRTWCSSALQQGVPAPLAAKPDLAKPEHPAVHALPRLNGGVCDALPLLGPCGLAIGRGRLTAAGCTDLARGIPFGARPATILARGRRRYWRAAGDDFGARPATTTDWRVLRCGRLRPLRFGRGTGGQSWSGLGWSGFVRSEFRPPDKRPSGFFFVPASPEQVARDVRSAASKGQICPVTGLCEVPWWGCVWGR